MRKPAARNSKLILLSLSCALHAQLAFGAVAMNLDRLLEVAHKESEMIQAAETMIDSIRAEISGRDIVLSPRLDAELAGGTDNRDTTVSSQRIPSRLLEVSLTKLFSTGTSLTFSAGHTDTRLNSVDRSIGSWELRLSQSLWRDAFGRSTRLRHEAEKAEFRSRVFSTLLQKQNFLLELEQVYWDLVLALKEEKTRESNLEKSKRVESWTRDRVRRRVALESDLLQAQALVSARLLELKEVRNRIATIRNKIRQLIPGQNPEEWTIDLRELERARNLESLLAVSTGKEKPVQLAALAANYLSQQAMSEAARVEDSYRPKLDAYVSYGQNGAEENFSGSWNRALNPEYSGARVGLLFSVELDSSLKRDQRRAAELRAQARELEARARMRASSFDWDDLVRQVNALKAQVTEATRLSEIQEKKVEAERINYRLGRTTIFQLITFEIDAANAELGLVRKLAELRKTESSARIFTRQEGGDE